MDHSLHITSISKELKLILELLKEESNSNIDITDVDWNLFVDLSIHHRVYPLLHTKIKKLGTMLPAFVSDTLNFQYRQNIFQMLRLTAEMEQVSKLFSEQQIRTIFLKGPVLAQDLYGDLSLRTSSDLDFLIPIQHLEKAEEILVNLGYEKEDYFDTVLNDWRWRHHHVTYFHPKKGMKLEIHWRLHPGPGLEPSFEDLWERRTTSALTSFPVYLLGKEDLFWFLVSHGSRHGWSRLRWLVDIQLILKQRLNWDMIIRLFKKYHNRYLGGQAIILVSQLLNVKLSKEMEPFLKKRSTRLAQEAIFYLEDMINLHSDPVPKEVSSYHAKHLFNLMSLKQKILYLLSMIHPLPEDAKTLPLPKQIHFLYFPLRPVLWAWRKTKKTEFRKGEQM
jgi:hypothetical protein